MLGGFEGGLLEFKVEICLDLHEFLGLVLLVGLEEVFLVKLLVLQGLLVVARGFRDDAHTLVGRHANACLLAFDSFAEKPHRQAVASEIIVRHTEHQMTEGWVGAVL